MDEKIICTAIVCLGLTRPLLGQEQLAMLDVTADAGITSTPGKARTSNGTGPTTPICQNQNWYGLKNKIVTRDGSVCCPRSR